jgi:hypothetical protein
MIVRTRRSENMRWIVLAIALTVGTAQAQTVTVSVTTAQQDAEQMARTGVLRHCGRNGGRREGIGFGSTPEQALRNCCFYGRYRIREQAVVRGARGWFAVIRYE